MIEEQGTQVLFAARLKVEDREIAEYLRTLDVPVVPVVNKADRKGVELQAHEFYRLGLGEPIVVSAAPRRSPACTRPGIASVPSS